MDLKFVENLQTGAASFAAKVRTDQANPGRHAAQ
jgi:hypothetical protein